MKSKRTKHPAEFKAKVALEALREQETVPELARRYKVHTALIYKWKNQLLDNLPRAFAADDGRGGETGGREDELLRKIGELTVERDFLAVGLGRLR